ncbi:MAG: hypothetical protein A2096_09695 [Spirochaetes bacterium GWF1_41_5]|nr:MAG: hypothetical protein A2096_09695 [Spirochaetes bacterium GWF1_41_5]HBE03250.1 hypothetical protein [Spirochaetia bacterium]
MELFKNKLHILTDILLIGALLAVSARLILTSGKTAERVIIFNNGKKNQYLLSENRVIELKGATGDFVCEISDKRVRAVKSCCRDKLCIKNGWIRTPGQSIICLPEKIMINIPEEEPGYDVLLR